MATPTSDAAWHEFVKALRVRHKDGLLHAFRSDFYEMLMAAQDLAGIHTVEYHRGRFFYITPSHFFFAHHKPGITDCTWIVPGTYGKQHK